jgi:hypothetical protein
MSSSPVAPSVLAPELSAFAETLRHADAAALATDTLRWFAEDTDVAVGEERALPALITVASVYARFCAPSDTSADHNAVVARFTLLFFLVDDAAEGQLPNLLLDAAQWSIGRHTTALRRWLSEFSEHAPAHPRLRARFAHAYHDYLAARRVEHLNKSRPLGIEAHWVFRRRSIFMDPYLDLWMILRGIDLDALAEQDFAAARALAVDLVLLANDLASAERDAADGASPDDLNLIHSYARQHAESEASALERLVTLYNRLAAEYLAALARACAARPGTDAERYADVLSGVVQGNVASVLALGFRYPGAEAVMRRLSAVR